MKYFRHFTGTSLYLVKLKIFEWTKFLRRHLHQFQGNWAGRNFLTASRKCSLWIQGLLRMQECRDECEIYNYQRIQLSNNKFINRILRVRLTWLDCNLFFRGTQRLFSVKYLFGEANIANNFLLLEDGTHFLHWLS